MSEVFEIRATAKVPNGKWLVRVWVGHPCIPDLDSIEREQDKLVVALGRYAYLEDAEIGDMAANLISSYHYDTVEVTSSTSGAGLCLYRQWP